MKPTITKSEENIKVLSKMVSSGYYKGEIAESKFVLKRIALANNILIYGTDDGNGKYLLKADFWFPMSLAYYFFLILTVIVFTIALMHQKWAAVTLIIIAIPIIIFANHHQKNKELESFTNKFLSFKST